VHRFTTRMRQANKDGRSVEKQAEELCEGRQTQPASPAIDELTDDFIDDLFARVDRNGDGTITCKEMIKTIRCEYLPRQTPELNDFIDIPQYMYTFADYRQPITPDLVAGWTLLDQCGRSWGCLRPQSACNSAHSLSVTPHATTHRYLRSSG
jgi:hypothetical protein